MLKPLVVWAVVANLGFITLSEGNFAPYPDSAVRGNPHRKCHGSNEVFNECPNPCPPQRCGVNKAAIRCAAPPKPGSSDCKPGCVCAKGHVRNRAGTCIPEKDCVYDCAKNETLDECVSDCPPRYCGVNIAVVLCAPIDECDCKKGCRCKDRYLRNGDGDCVLEKDCPKCDGLNEEYDVCPNPCPPQDCDVDPSTIKCPAPPQPGDKRCIPGCRCFEGYARNASGICVPRNECPQSCGENEIYYDGTTEICRPLDCSQVGFIEPCTDSIEAGCICDYGYVWDDEGNCIPMTDCPSCGGDSNAISGCGTNCGKHCYDYYNHTVPCKEICYENACDCRKGFYYDHKKGKCVKPDKCSSKCPKNETLDSCVSNCPPRYCGVEIAAVSCAAIPECDCKEGCRCKDGYLRNAQGFCVHEKDCPKCYGKNEVYDVCPNPCPPQDCSVDPRVIRCAAPPQPGDDACKPGCRCINGHARDENGECIPREQCPGYCGEHAIYHDGSSEICRPLDCSQVGFPINCTDVEPGCICDYGYVRNSFGECVPMRDCESCGGDDNSWSGCGVNCGKHCSDVFNITRPCPKICYPNACDCKDGFYYDENQKSCVPREECTKPCGKDEVFSKCTNDDCTPKNCSQLGFPMPCLKSDSTRCTKGCICKEGFVRADNGTCIPKKDCPSCGGDPHAESGCGVNCGRYCSNYNETDIVCPAICNTNGCDCKKGYVVDDNTGKCVRPSHCVSCKGDHHAEPGCDQDCSERCPGPKPDDCVCYKDSCKCKDGYVYDPKAKKCVRVKSCKPPCGKHEVLSNCSNGGCGPWTCDDVGFPTGCVKMDQKYCKVGCVCEEGYVRQNGTCIPATECPSCGGDPNAEAGCGGNCGRLCSNYKDGNVSCTAECQRNACDCKKQYVYDEEQQKCVHPKQCKKRCTGKNEEYVSCPQTCPPQTCESIGKIYHCPMIKIDEKDCKGACRCKEGFYRNKIGECISEKECKKCPGLHEYYSCGGACDNVCETIHKQNQTHCPIINKQCNRKCYCEKGYARDKNNTCIPIKECPKQPRCKENEIFSNCTNGGCDARNCSQLGQPVPCVKLNPDDCIKGCICKEGYLRASNGTCVPKDKCDNCNRPHEHYESCPSTCPPQTCGSIGKQFKCAATKVCKGACRCDKGYYRNKIGECIRKEDCLKCRGPHEYFSCGGACDNVCETIHIQNQTHCPIINIQCNQMCYCDEGYARDENNTCIPIEKCPKPKCPKHERFVDCPPAVCAPQNCTQLGFPIECPDYSDSGCPVPPGCICEHDYVRNSKGKCVHKSKCPSCGGDPNAQAGCGVNCGKLCPNQYPKPIPCPKICYPNACACKEGFVYDNNTKQCVDPEDCTPPCGDNEEFSSCINGGCGPRNCSQLGQPIRCVKINPDYCKKGCVCKDGFLRAKNGTCVPKDQCDNLKCGENEMPVDCPPAVCAPQKCSELGFPVACPDFVDGQCPVPPGCICKENYVRNDEGKCIPKEDCPSCGGDPNAVSGCGVNCGKICPNHNRTDMACSDICEYNGCDCRKGYVYDQYQEKCVKRKNCTIPCGTNERYEKCPDNTCEPKTCSELGFPLNCSANAGDECNGEPACICDYGYVRNKKGTCIPKKSCPSCGGDRNAESGCGINCGRHCSNYKAKHVICPRICKFNACDCKKEYVYDDNTDECVKPEQCTPTCGENEEYSACVNGGCDARNCSQLGKPVPCVNIIEGGCIKGCICVEGYLRADNGTCVKKEECPVQCGENEMPNDCPDALCTPQYCSQLGFPIDCPALSGNASDTCPGEPGCICIDNYVRDDTGKCVPIDSCPSCGGDPNAKSGCGVNCGRLCSNYKKKNVFCPLYCKLNGCDCKEDFVFDSNVGLCVRPNNCTPTCGANEVYKQCANKECKRTKCSQIDEPTSEDHDDQPPNDSDSSSSDSSDTNSSSSESSDTSSDSSDSSSEEPSETDESSESEPQPDECVGACVCQEGYLKDDDGVCVPEDQCPKKCSKPHEIYVKCQRTCPPQTCESLTRAYVCPNPPEGEDHCTPGCQCEEGYYRNAIGECISEEDCLKCTNPYEYFTCGTCDNVCSTLSQQNQTNCPIKYKKCIPQCYCLKDYARDDNGICIPIKQCNVSCKGDPNAIPGCGNYCGRRCSDYKKGDLKCPIGCYLGGCACKQSYVYDDNKKKCVLPKNCTPTCGPKERYEEHPSMVCDPLTCDEVGQEKKCPKKPRHNDRPTCICKKDLVRNDQGECIPMSDCCK
ncbi:unnamed protein product [Spodoptera littoralis]|uniref:EGF-like domain-containing protein n=1 Tax=Spodoptera littoralis TaxID=7109 RepID=A0A9P0N7F4_SPOLI|nr:unnamed protein product [Spodoptera littoralis]CAH1644195.1 unnamed protein product [Spodoptera littoralis]